MTRKWATSTSYTLRRNYTVYNRACDPGSRFREFPGFINFFDFLFQVFELKIPGFVSQYPYRIRVKNKLQLFLYSIKIDRFHSQGGETILFLFVTIFKLLGVDCWGN